MATCSSRADTWLGYLEPAFRERAIRIDERRPTASRCCSSTASRSCAARPARRSRRHRDGLARPNDASGSSATRTAARPAATIRVAASARHGRRAHRRRAPLSDHRDLLGRARVRRPASRPPTRAPTTAGSSTSAAPIPARLVPDRPHLASSTPPGAVEEVDARAEGRLRRRLPLAGSCRPAAAGTSTTRSSRGSGRRSQDLDMPIAFHVVVRDRPVGSRPWLGTARSHRRRAVRLRVPRPRRDGGVHLDADARDVRELPAPRARCSKPAPTGSPPGSTASTTSSEVMRPLVADPHGAERVLQAPVRDLRRSGRVAHRSDRRAPRPRLLRLGVRLPAPRRLVRRRPRAERADSRRSPRTRGARCSVRTPSASTGSPARAAPSRRRRASLAGECQGRG